MQPAGVTTQKFFPWVQALRAFAALSVAFVHFAHDAAGNGGDPSGAITIVANFFPWAAGVDLFFVISGFVIVHASAPLFGASTGPLVFLRRRLTRIVPLYWIMTTAFLAMLFLNRSAIHGAAGGAAYIAASYLFIPWPRPDGLIEPALGLGWTLNFEMFFYIVFTPFLLLPRNLAVAAAGFLLCAFAGAGLIIGFQNPQLGFWSNPIILEFVAGMGIALALERALQTGWILTGSGRLTLVILAVIALHFATFAPLAWRAVVFGVPAACLVIAAVFGRPAVMNRYELILVRLGDASYAMYLFHPFVMRGTSLLWHKIHAGNELAGTIYVVLGLVIAQICAVAINVTLERRLNRMLRRRTRVLLNEAV